MTGYSQVASSATALSGKTFTIWHDSDEGSYRSAKLFLKEMVDAEDENGAIEVVQEQVSLIK